MKFYFKLKSFVPLIIIFAFIIVFSVIASWWRQVFSYQSIMIDFMAGFFLVFGAFKLIKLSAFVEAYAMYDEIAKRVRAYGYIYPFVEIALGLAFLLRFEIVAVAWVTLGLMIINSFGAYNGIRDKKVLMCGCLGTVFKLPMSYVSLGEDLLMAAMAVMIILGL
ncbi:MAG: hypothetical protein JHC69_13215 [Akkermansiaceae bacterium]|nr:hypothetical protein [Akkermansiaceae bacterium]